MHKKSQIASLKHRATRKKRAERRKMARSLLRGDVDINQLVRLVGDSSNGVLKTVAYLSELESITIPPVLAGAVSQAMAPASEIPASSGGQSKIARINSGVSGTMGTKANVSPKPKPANPRGSSQKDQRERNVVSDDVIVETGDAEPNKTKKPARAKATQKESLASSAKKLEESPSPERSKPRGRPRKKLEDDSTEQG